MVTAPEENPSEGAPGLGTGGKFRKRPFRRSQTTPYDRQPTALRNPSRNNGWLSKLLDPAQRLINYSAHSLFSSVFRKRLPPPPSPPQNPPSSETEQEVRDHHREEPVFGANNSSGKQQGDVAKSDFQISCSDGGGLTELEKLLREKTFTRSEIDHLTALMQSRTVEFPFKEEEKRTEVVPLEPMLYCEQKEEYPRTPAPENGIENRAAVTPYVTSSIPNEDVASTAELAKAYMGSRPSKVSPSILGLRSPALREDPALLKSQNFTHKSPITSIMPRVTRHVGVHENGFMTSRSRGRSAIYSMARTPYARIYPTSAVKGGSLAVEGEPSSSAQSALDYDMVSGSKQGALKRRNSTLDNDLGSVGPIRRVRHKSNLLYSKGLGLPLSGSPLPFSTSGVGIDATQLPSSCTQKPILLDEAKRRHMKLPTENVSTTMPSMSFPPLPLKSSEMASKILQQLDKLVSPNKEKSSELRLPSVNGKSPTKLSPSMLRGQALRSMEIIDSSKLLDNTQDNKLDGVLGNLSANAQKLTSQIDKVENGPLKLVAPSDGRVPVVADAGATVPSSQVISSKKSVDSSMTKPVSYPLQKKRAFHMSAHEDYLDLDDGAYANGAVSSISTAEKETTGSTAMAEKNTIGTEAVVPPEIPTALSVVMPSRSSTIDGKVHVVSAMVGEKVNASTSITSTIPDSAFQPETVVVKAATQTIFGYVKPASPNGSTVNTPLFNFGSKLVSSAELTAANTPSMESNKSAPIFGLGKIVSPDGPGADAPSVNFGTSKNVDKVRQMSFTSSIGGESAFPKFGASSDSKLGSSNCAIPTTVAGATDSMTKVTESDNVDAKTNIDAGFSNRLSEPAVSSATSTSLLTPPTSILTSGHNSNQNNGPHPSTSSFSSAFPSLVSNNFTSQNMSSSSSLAASSIIGVTAASHSNMTSSSTATILSSNSSFSAPLVASSSSTTSFFKFGSSPVPSTSLPVSSTSGSEPVETKSRQDAGIGNLSCTAFGSLSATGGSTGTGIFGFSSPAMTTVNSQSQVAVFGTSSGSVLGSQASTTIGFAASTQSQSVPFGSSASTPSFGLTGNAAFSSGSSLFSSTTSGFAASTQSQSVPFGSSASTPLFGLTGNTAFSSGSSLFSSSSPATNIFNSSTAFGLSTSASSSAANSVSSNSSTSSTLFGQSSWQPSKSPFGSAFNSSSSGFSFGASTASVASTGSPMMFTSAVSSPQFAFTSAAATSSSQPAFGSSNPVLPFGSVPAVNNDQTSMEDSMAEDTVQATPPATPIFGQQPAPPQSNFVFGAPASSGSSPFQFGSQQNTPPQNPSPFQASGSLDFNSMGGGSFSLGTGGGDKSGRKYVKVKHKNRRKYVYEN